jgi:signal transduction histidine kinase
MLSSRITPMPKEICCKNWAQLFSFIENTPNLPSGLSGRTAVEKFLDGLIDNPEFLISSPDELGLDYPVKEKHLRDNRYWHSNDFSLKLFENAAKVIGGYRPLFKAGIIAGYRMIHEMQPKYFQFFRLFSINRLFILVTPLNVKLNKTKEPKILENRKGFARIKFNYKNEYKDKVSKHVCDWNTGIYTGMGKFTGAYDLKVRETECVVEGCEDCILELNWTHHNIFRRFIIFCHSIIDPGYIAERDLDNLFLNYMLLTQEGIIETRTEELKHTQAKLFEAEKRSLEHRITGGFAHEMRNALAGAQLEFKTALNYNNKGKSSADVLIGAATVLLKNIDQIHEEFNIPREKIATQFIPELKTIAEIANHLSSTISSVSNDIERGLSITNQIRDYAKMSEFKPGNNKINIIDLLSFYKERYARLFKLNNIQYFVEGPKEVIVAANELHLNSIFSNLILNARDALSEKGSNDSIINVFVENQYNKSGNKVVVKVQDNGLGIPERHLTEIFEPFFSTKPNTGTGLGLGIVKKLVRLYGGDIEVQSETGKGTTFTITLPEKRNG